MKREKVLQILVVTAITLIPVTFTVGCGLSDTFKCSMCGDDSTRIGIYASGTSSNGIDYQSCVGPAGCLGIGLDSYCWPTECLKVNYNNGTGNVTGCIYYYNGCGCIANTDIKSKGTYTDDTLGCGYSKCAATKYVENNAENSQAKTQNSCLGISCGKAQNTESKYLNNAQPRQFINGCWSCPE